MYKLFLIFSSGIKRYLLIPLAFVLLTSLCNAQEKNVTILYTNDIESVYKPIEAFWNKDIKFIGGMSYLANLIKIKQEESEVSFLFDAGDIFTGALSAVTEGKLPFEIYSTMGYDAIALGNHEFEYGWAKLAQVKQRARFPVLNCNINYKNTAINFCQSFTILEKNGIRIGVIGTMGIEAFKNTINPVHREGVEIHDPYPIIQTIIDEIRNEVDLIVLLTHQNQSAPMQTDKEVDPEVQRGFNEDYEMAGKLNGVDVLIGGHSDNGLWKPVKHPKTGTLICLTFGQGKYLGFLNLSINKDKVTMIDGKLIPVDNSLLKQNEKVENLLVEARKQNPDLVEILCKTDKPAYRKYYRESTLGNLLSDILKEYSQADIALMNSGSIRADLNKGNITVEDIINIYPFIGKYHVVEIDGQSLKDLLEYSCQLTYGLVQFSGVSIKYNSKLPKGNRLIEVKINNEPLDLLKKYTVTSSAFVANGGDGFEMFQNGTLLRQSDKKMVDYFIDYFRGKQNLYIPPLGRQIDISKK